MEKSSENDQSTGHFQSFFFVPSTINLKKNPVNQLIKKIWPKNHLNEIVFLVPATYAPLRMQKWATFNPPDKHHLNGIFLAS